ncbi:MAG: hypothetical protein RL454_27, partial [Actinomycetota bacterium]
LAGIGAQKGVVAVLFLEGSKTPDVFFRCLAVGAKGGGITVSRQSGQQDC